MSRTYRSGPRCASCRCTCRCTRCRRSGTRTPRPGRSRRRRRPSRTCRSWRCRSRSWRTSCPQTVQPEAWHWLDDASTELASVLPERRHGRARRDRAAAGDRPIAEEIAALELGAASAGAVGGARAPAGADEDLLGRHERDVGAEGAGATRVDVVRAAVAHRPAGEGRLAPLGRRLAGAEGAAAARALLVRGAGRGALSAPARPGSRLRCSSRCSPSSWSRRRSTWGRLPRASMRRAPVRPRRRPPPPRRPRRRGRRSPRPRPARGSSRRDRRPCGQHRGCHHPYRRPPSLPWEPQAASKAPTAKVTWCARLFMLGFFYAERPAAGNGRASYTLGHRRPEPGPMSRAKRTPHCDPRTGDIMSAEATGLAPRSAHQGRPQPLHGWVEPQVVRIGTTSSFGVVARRRAQNRACLVQVARGRGGSTFQ